MTAVFALPQLFKRLLTAMTLAVIVVLGAPGAASAFELDQQPVAATVMVPMQAQNVADSGSVTSFDACGNTTTREVSGSDSLPINRWRGGTTQLHTYLDSGFTGTGAIAESVQRDGATGAMLSASNSMWGFGWTLTDIAVNFCPMDWAGIGIDKIVGGLGQIIFPPGAAPVLITALIAVALGAAFWRSRRGIGFGTALRSVVGKVAVVGMIVVMLGGAAASTGGPEETYRPGLFSPGWIVSKMNTTVSELASIPSDLMSPEETEKLESNTNAWNCESYIAAMHTSYRAWAGTSLGAKSAVPLALSRMWEGSVLQSWKNIQYSTAFSDSRDNPADWAYCHQLDWSSSVPPILLDDSGKVDSRNWLAMSSTPSMLLARSLEGAESIGRNASVPSAGAQEFVQDRVKNDDGKISQAFAPTSESNRDRAIMGWSQCGIDPGSRDFIPNRNLAGKYDDRDFDADKCHSWLTGTSDVDKHFETPQDVQTVNEKSANNDVARYINTLHGYESSEGITVGFALAGSALVMVIVFGFLAGAVILAKLLMVVMMLGLFVALVAGLLPGRTFAPFGKMLLKTLGVVVLVVLVQVLFSAVVSVSQIAANAGAAVAGAGSFMGAIWTGVAPAAVVIALHFIFKQLRLPSPFNPASGLAWGKAMASHGGDVMSSGMAGAMNRWEHRQMGKGRQAVGSATRTALQRVTPGAMGAAAQRRGSVAGNLAATAAGSAVGAAVGNQVSDAITRRGERTAGPTPKGQRPELSDTASLAERAQLAGAAGVTAGTDASRAVRGDNARVDNSKLASMGDTREERQLNAAKAMGERKAALQEQMRLKELKKAEIKANLPFEREAARRGVSVDELKASGWSPADRGGLKKAADGIATAGRTAWNNKGKIAAGTAGVVAATALLPGVATGLAVGGATLAAGALVAGSTKDGRVNLKEGASALGESARRLKTMRGEASVSNNRIIRAMGSHSNDEMDRIVGDYRQRDAEIRKVRAHDEAQAEAEAKKGTKQVVVGGPEDPELTQAIREQQDAEEPPYEPELEPEPDYYEGEGYAAAPAQVVPIHQSRPQQQAAVGQSGPGPERIVGEQLNRQGPVGSYGEQPRRGSVRTEQAEMPRNEVASEPARAPEQDRAPQAQESVQTQPLTTPQDQQNPVPLPAPTVSAQPDRPQVRATEQPAQRPAPRGQARPQQRPADTSRVTGTKSSGLPEIPQNRDRITGDAEVRRIRPNKD